MSTGFPARRRAERFASALDRASSADPTTAPPAVDLAWLELVQRLRDVPPPAPRPEFAADLRERLMTAARTGLAPVPAPRPAPARSRGQRRLSAALAGLALVGATGGVAAASQGALPGETLYPLKRALEDVRTGLEGDPGDKGTALIGQAFDRLDEVRALSVDTDADPAVVDETLEVFVAQAGEAAELKLEAFRSTDREAEVLEVRGFAADGVASLQALEPVVPASSRPTLLRAAAVLWQIDNTASRTCTGCGGPLVDLGPDLRLDPAAAGLGDALGLEQLRAVSAPEARPVRTDRGRPAPADGQPRREDVVRPARDAREPRDGGDPDQGRTVRTDQVPEVPGAEKVTGPLGPLGGGAGDGVGDGVGDGLGGGSTAGGGDLRDLADRLSGGAGDGSKDGAGSASGSSDGDRDDTRRSGLRGALEDVDATLDDLLP